MSVKSMALARQRKNGRVGDWVSKKNATAHGWQSRPADGRGRDTPHFIPRTALPSAGRCALALLARETAHFFWADFDPESRHFRDAHATSCDSKWVANDIVGQPVIRAIVRQRELWR